MGHMRTMITLSNQLKTARLEAIQKHGARYQDKVAPYKDAITRHMAATGMTPLDATLRLAKTSVDYNGDPEMILAAGVELVMAGGAS